MGRKKKRPKDPICGVYKIAYRGGIYIGSSIDIYNRFDNHRTKLKHGKHSSKEFQKEYLKYGGVLKLKIIFECNTWDMVNIEYKILRNCEIRKMKLWNAHGRNSLNNHAKEIQYVFSLMD